MLQILVDEVGEGELALQDLLVSSLELIVKHLISFDPVLPRVSIVSQILMITIHEELQSTGVGFFKFPM